MGHLFDFAFEDCSVRWEGEKAMDLGGGVQAVLTGATLSPLSFQVDYTVEGGIPSTGRAAGTTRRRWTAVSTTCRWSSR